MLLYLQATTSEHYGPLGPAIILHHHILSFLALSEVFASTLEIYPV